MNDNIAFHPTFTAKIEELVQAMTLAPHEAIAQEVRAEMEASFTGDDADLQGFIQHSHVVFGTACAFKAAERLAEHDAVSDARWKADMRAVDRWRAANPGNDLVLPDHADLVVWLLEQLPPGVDPSVLEGMA